MPESPPEEGFDTVLERLEKQLARLADGTAPLDELVAAHDEAQRLIKEAQARLRALMERVDAEAGGS